MADIPVTPNYERFKRGLESGKRYLLFEGSSGSSKTISIIQGGIEYCLTNPNKVWTTFRNDRATCHDSAVKDFKFILGQQFGIWNLGKWNVQNLEYEFPNGSKYQFRGANDAAKLHGPRRDVAHFNEVMEIDKEAFDQVDGRTADFIVCDWNPSFNHHWIFDRIMGSGREFYVHSTFEDNPFLAEQARRVILSWEPTAENKAAGTADEWKWSVYGLGKRGRREGAIFKLWDITDDFPNPMDCQRHGYGLDYGFSLDPTALIECALFQDRLYLRERLYEKELVAQANPLDPQTPSIEGRLRELSIPEHARIHGESARPEINRALQKSGFKIVPTIKSADSILAGIDRLRTFPIFIHRNSQNAQREFEGYTWDKNASGEFLDRPIDRDNHLIDAARYWALGEVHPERSLYSQKGKAKSRRAKSNLKRWR